MKSLLQIWKESATNRPNWAALLREPVAQDALAIVKEGAYAPRDLPNLPAGIQVTLTEWQALMGARREGYLECLANLLSLAELTPHKLKDRKPWDSIDKEAALQEAVAELTTKEGPTAGSVSTLQPPKEE